MKSSAALTANERGNVLDMIGKLHRDPEAPGLSLERITRAKDPNVWAARVSRDIRVVLWRKGSLNLLLFTGHHDDAYQWAERHRVDTDRFSGALQLVNLPLVELPPPEQSDPVLQTPDSRPPFMAYSQQRLLDYGVPSEWVALVRRATSIDDFADNIAPDLPPDVAERLIALGLGETPETVAPVPTIPIPADSAGESEPTVGRQFYPISDLDELNRLLTYPLATWLAFLHPDQRRLAERSFTGPVKVTGSAGTGKTVLAMHRARFLARNGKRVLVTSYTNALCHSLERQLDLLCTNEERRRIQVLTVHGIASHVARTAGERSANLRDDDVRRDISAAWRDDLPLTPNGLVAEWHAVIAPHGIESWDSYRAVSRVGRGHALSVAQRKLVWDALDPVFARWRRQRRFPFAWICQIARRLIDQDRDLIRRAFTGGADAVIVDEVQDLGPQELRLLATLAGDGPDRLFLTGDGGQRIYERRTSLGACGIPVRGRSFTLRINYRTTAQIRRFADRVLPIAGDDLDGGAAPRRAVRSVLSGSTPQAVACVAASAEADAIAAEINACVQSGYVLDDIAVFTRTNARAEHLRGALQQRRIATHDLDPSGQPPRPSAPAVTVTTLHRAKGMEYKAVIVSGVSGDILPLPAALRDTADPADEEDTHQRERQLLYVGLTRARDRLLVTWIGEPSTYLEDALTTPGLTGSHIPAPTTT